MAKAKTAKTTKTTRKKSPLPKQVTQAVAAALDKQAHDLTILDLKKAAGFTDYFIICTGNNSRQVKAIADHVRDTLAEDGAKPAHVEGNDRSEWILLDYFDFIVHIFAPETRTFYDLERLWGSAEVVPHEGLA
jgi:ribosome-associated protein